ncbi:MAG TPA: hypothetical protein VHZ74_22470 [Bryobacteraceae bacterium]|jgi:hypothetical protein|nr:hypothetical protein [Bryobacteraceae bacterium]
MGKFVLSAGVFAAILYLAPSPGLATPEYSRRSDKECSYCHPAKGYSLNEAGKYYKEHKTLRGYSPPAHDDVSKKPGASAVSPKSSH